MLNTRPVSSRSAFGAEPRILSSKRELISAPLLLVVTWKVREAGATTPDTCKSKKLIYKD